MSAGASGAGEFSSAARRAPEPQEVFPTEPPLGEVWEQVLRETLAVCTSEAPLEPAQMQRLRQVAQRFRGRPLEVDPVGTELVYAVFEGHFVEEGKPCDFWRAAAAHVAQTLLDDPVAGPRLERFWARLTAEAP